MLDPQRPALILAPMDGITDAPMRALQGETGAFTFTVSEFLRVSAEVPPKKTFYREIPELCCGGVTPGGLPVQVQLLGGDPDRMARAAVVACEAGAQAIDINFGCPAPTVNRHDGGATLLRYPHRIREIVSTMRAAVPAAIPVSAKLRLGWDSIDAIFENAAMAAEGGASWLTIHARTRVQGYAPPTFWKQIGQVKTQLGIPIVANGDIWNLDGFRRCQEESRCHHFMLGRGALANPLLPAQIARELGIYRGNPDANPDPTVDWGKQLWRLVELTRFYEDSVPRHTVFKLKQWLRLATLFGGFHLFDEIKRAETVEELFAGLANNTSDIEASSERRAETVWQDTIDTVEPRTPILCA